MCDSPRRLAIVGAGFSGIVTAIRLLSMSIQPTRLLLIDENTEELAGGVAYSDLTTDWEMLLNLQASRISIFREDPDDFLRWANIEADRGDWPSPWRSTIFAPASAVPRRIYGRYLRDRLARAVKEAQPEVVLETLQAQVTSLTEERHCVSLRCIETPGRNQTQIRVDKVVLATGHIRARVAKFAELVGSHARYISEPYSVAGRQSIQSIPSEGTILVLGTGLTAYDCALMLRRNGHRGSITLCSRGAHTHFPYRPGHAHEILKLPRPAFLDKKPIKLAKIVPMIMAEFLATKNQLASSRPDIVEELVSERIIKAWEPYIPELVNALPISEVREALGMYKSLLTTRRIGTVPEISEAVGRAELSVLSAHVVGMHPYASDTIQVFFQGREPESEIYNAVICGLGYSPDYTSAAAGVWRELIEVQRRATPHKITGWGIEVNQFGQVIDHSGRPSERVHAVGPMRQGDELARNGRLGAFVFSIGTLRNQATVTAWAVLREASHAGQYVRTQVRENIRGKVDGVTALLRAEARLLTTQLRRERESALIDVRTILSDDNLGMPAAGDSSDEYILALRQNIQMIALQRLTDISVIAGQADL